MKNTSALTITPKMLRKMTMRAIREKQFQEGGRDGRFCPKVVPNKKALQNKKECRNFQFN